MNINQFIADPQQLLPFMAALSVCATILVVAWPYLQRDNLAARMRSVLEEREQIRLRERARINADGGRTSLRTEPKKLFQTIVDRFNLVKQVEDGEAARMLRRAGFRGQGPVITFLAVRLLAPCALFPIAAFYIFLVLDLQLPWPVQLLIALVVGSLGYYAPAIFLRNRITKRQKSIKRAWPDALDLLLICVESGMGIESAFQKVSMEIGPQSRDLAEELAVTTAELSYLQDRRRAFDNLGDRTGLETVRSVVTSLIQAEKYGTSLGQSLRVLAQESRDTRMSEAEKKAASLPPKLTVPMILFFLPVLFAIIITPAGIQIANIP